MLAAVASNSQTEPAAVPQAHHRSSRTSRIVGVVVGAAVVAAVFVFVLPRIASYGDVWHVVEGLTWLQAGALLLATAFNLATDPLPWAITVPGLGVRRAFTVTQASTASTYIAPAGDAVGLAVTFRILRGWGFDNAAVSLAVALTGTWNFLVSLGMPAVALGLLSLEKEHYPLLTTVAVVGAAIFVIAVAALAVALERPQVARRMGDAAARLADRALRRFRRGPVAWSGETVVRFRDQAIGLIQRRWQRLTLATVAGQLSVFVILLVSLRVAGVPASAVTLAEAFAAWVLVRLISAFPITPGGVGIVEVGLTTALVAFGGQNAEVVAAVLLYRVFSTVPTLVLGLIAAAVWRRVDAPAASGGLPGNDVGQGAAAHD
jgi:uncharacterized protein (TIRG00374 family)